MALSTSSDNNGRVELKSLMKESLLCEQLQPNVSVNSSLFHIRWRITTTVKALLLM